MTNQLQANVAQASLEMIGLHTTGSIFFNLDPAELIEHSLARNEGQLTATGALMADTGKFTGRSPKDRFIVQDKKTKDTVWWGDINIPFDPDQFDRLFQKMKTHLQDKDLFVRDVHAGADPQNQLNIRVATTWAWHNLFCHTMFLRPSPTELKDFRHDFTVICAPDFQADPDTDGTRNPNFAILNLSQRIILIGGTGYAGEIKKGIFSVLNYLLPHERQILSMHCAANMGKKGDTAIFFGLSGTGKTTLSTDPDRALIGDDEHGWTDTGVFNFEGGCYAKVANLSRNSEPEIWDAIKFGAIVENTRFKPASREVDYSNTQVTENTRTAYPIHYIPHAKIPSIGGIPSTIFFLTADAFGVIPPISKLSKSQAMYHFISGYTAKVAGTEMGVSDPKLTFSACFGAAFLPLHPTEYARLLGDRMDRHRTQVWLINTGWTGGPYGTGSRIKLRYTRAMISAALEGSLASVAFEKDPIFGFEVPQTCPNVPADMLQPRNTWSKPSDYDRQASKLAESFIGNFRIFEADADPEILQGGPIG